MDNSRQWTTCLRLGWGVTTSPSSSPLLPENDDIARKEGNKRRAIQHSPPNVIPLPSYLSLPWELCAAALV